VTQIPKSNKAYIVSAILIVLILLVTLISWMQDNKTVEVTSTEQAESAFEIAVYYFPSRINDAKALTFYFNEHGHSVKMHRASSIEELEASRTSPSYIYFNQAQFKQAMGIKQTIEKVIGYPVNAYRYQNAQVSPAMMMVFTEHDR
jgi:hypothetical protein